MTLAPGAGAPIAPNADERAIYTIQGEIEVAGDTFGPAQLLILRPGDEVVVSAKANGTGDHVRFMLFGGAPMDGPRYLWWNFVSSRPECIEQAKEEWRQGQFHTVPGDEEEFIPLPEQAREVMRAEGGVRLPMSLRRPAGLAVALLLASGSPAFAADAAAEPPVLGPAGMKIAFPAALALIALAKSEKRVAVVEVERGSPTSRQTARGPEDWSVVIHDHHPAVQRAPHRSPKNTGGS